MPLDGSEECTVKVKCRVLELGCDVVVDCCVLTEQTSVVN
jgi:hypothetical protein